MGSFKQQPFEKSRVATVTSTSVWGVLVVPPGDGLPASPIATPSVTDWKDRTEALEDTTPEEYHRMKQDETR